jgi:hypothetical protein
MDKDKNASSSDQDKTSTVDYRYISISNPRRAGAVITKQSK